MTGHEHYREAERLLSHIGRSGLDVKESQVHATLALLRVIELSEENDGLTADLVRVMAERDAALATLAKVAAIVAEPGCHPRTDRIRAALVEPTS